MRSTMVVVLCVVVGSLVACGGGSEPASTPSSEGSEPTEPTGPTEPTEATEATEPTEATAGTEATADESAWILRFSRQGGLRGDDNAMTVDADGAVSVTTRDGTATLQLDDDRLADLEAALADLDWPALEDVDGQPDPGDDAYTFVVATPTHDAVTVTRNNLDPYPDLFLQANAIMDEAAGTL